MMARVTLLADEQLPADAVDLVEKMKTGRRGKLLNIYRMLLNAPPLAVAWFNQMNTVRWETDLSGRLRELVIIRIGYLLGADYMLRQHVPKLAEADGVSRVECEALKNSINLEIFSEQEKSVLKYVDQVTKGVNVDDNIYGAAAKNLTDRQMVELTVLIGAYNMHGRVMGALRVDLEENP